MPIKRLVVVSNRLPIVLEQDAGGDWQVRSGAGGLVAALAPVLRDRGGLWIGWPGATNPEAGNAIRQAEPAGIGYSLEPVWLTDDELERYYHGFANEIIWPLFHDLPGRCNFDPAYWPVYRQVNRKFAEAIERCTAPDDYIWVQDYHLLLVAEELRQRGIDQQLGFFLHIPFPPVEMLMKLPWRFQVMEALLCHDLLGFQTARDLRNFIGCVRALLPEARVHSQRMAATVDYHDRQARLGAFSIGIDHKKLVAAARSQEVKDRAWYIHEDLPNRKLILGVDRLDYTKGIPQRIRALANALERYPELRRKITFIQVVVPSREEVPEYQELKAEVEQLVGQVNGQFTTSGWTPIHYIYRSLEPLDLVAYYRTAEIALITPLKDGMNLVAKEYCACSVDDGCLILSEFAGAAAQLQHGALMVNPYDVEGVADALHQAFAMDQQERLRRMRRLRRTVARQNVFWWVDAFLRAAISRDLSTFPQVELFMPQAPSPVGPWLVSSGL